MAFVLVVCSRSPASPWQGDCFRWNARWAVCSGERWPFIWAPVFEETARLVRSPRPAASPLGFHARSHLTVCAQRISFSNCSNWSRLWKCHSEEHVWEISVGLYTRFGLWRIKKGRTRFYPVGFNSYSIVLILTGIYYKNLHSDTFFEWCNITLFSRESVFIPFTGPAGLEAVWCGMWCDSGFWGAGQQLMTQMLEIILFKNERSFLKCKHSLQTHKLFFRKSEFSQKKELFLLLF